MVLNTNLWFFFLGGGGADYSYMCFPCLKYDARQVGDHWLLAESVITKKLFFFCYVEHVPGTLLSFLLWVF